MPMNFFFFFWKWSDSLGFPSPTPLLFSVLQVQGRRAGVELPYHLQQAGCCWGGGKGQLLTTGTSNKHWQQVCSWQRLSGAWSWHAKTSGRRLLTHDWLGSLCQQTSAGSWGELPQKAASQTEHRGSTLWGETKVIYNVKTFPCSEWLGVIWDSPSWKRVD